MAQPDTDWTVPAPVIAVIKGTILDETGKPAADAIVSVGGKQYLTDVNGIFRIKDAQLDKNTSLVTVTKEGYFKAYRVFSGSENTNYTRIQLTKRRLIGSINGSAGGSVASQDGAAVTLDPNGVVNGQSGEQYSGKVKVYASYIDPSLRNIGSTVPGSFLATDQNNKHVFLTSFGMLAVELESEAGQKLQIAPGKKAILTTPIPASRYSSAPQKISMWYVDETTGVWKEEGFGVKENGTYKSEVKHFSYWNCDISGPVATISFTLQSAHGLPLAYQDVVIMADSSRSTNYSGTAHGLSDSLGNVKGPVPANVPLKLYIYDYCGRVSFTYDFGVLNSSKDFGVIVIPANSPSFFTVKGRVTDCDKQPIPNGYASCFYDYVLRETKADASGNFTFFIPQSCFGSTEPLLLTAMNAGGTTQGNSIGVPVVNPLTDAGDIEACGVNSYMFVKLKIDNDVFERVLMPEDVNATGSTGNGAWLWPGPGAKSEIFSGNSDYFINILFNSETPVPGSYPLLRLFTDKYPNTVLVQPIVCNMTEFAPRVGEYSAGRVIGQFKDSADLSTLHQVDFAFRIKRY